MLSELCEKCKDKRTCKYATRDIYIGRCDDYVEKNNNDWD